MITTNLYIMGNLVEIFLVDFLKEVCPDYFGKHDFTYQILDRGDGDLILKITWDFTHKNGLYSGFGLIEVLAWIYSKQQK